MGLPVPCIVKMKSKPCPVGMMTKNLADVETGIMMRLEMVTVRAESDRKRFNRDGLPKGTGVVLRLAQPWFTTGRHIVADAAFASVITAVECRKRGLHFTGVVKTAHRFFPKKHLETKEFQDRGDHAVCTVTKEGVHLRALGWNEGKRDSRGRIKPKCYISTVGTTVAGVPHKKTRYARYTVGNRQAMRVYHVPIPRPELVSSYYDGCQAIDVHNHLAVGLGLEERKTIRWEYRYFQTFLRFIVTDAYLAWKHFGLHQDASIATFRDYLTQLLFDNTFGLPANAAPLRPNQRAAVRDGGIGNFAVSQHHQASLKKTQCYAHYANNPRSPRITCKQCKALTPYYCQECTADDSSPGTIVSLCADSRKSCFRDYHLALSGLPPTPQRRRHNSSDSDEDEEDDDDYTSEDAAYEASSTSDYSTDDETATDGEEFMSDDED